MLRLMWWSAAWLLAQLCIAPSVGGGVNERSLNSAARSLITRNTSRPYTWTELNWIVTLAAVSWIAEYMAIKYKIQNHTDSVSRITMSVSVNSQLWVCSILTMIITRYTTSRACIGEVSVEYYELVELFCPGSYLMHMLTKAQWRLVLLHCGP